MADYLNAIVQPRKSIPTGWAFVGGEYVPSVAGKTVKCLGASLNNTGTEGYLNVHLIDDPATQYYLLPLTNGAIVGALFDKVIEADTTATIADVTLFVMVE